MLDLKTTIQRQRELKAEAGVSNWEQSIKVINKERVNSDRGKKLSFTWSQIKRAYKRQRGICPVCQHEMALDRKSVHGDHVNPNLSEQEGLNSERNLAATHSKCNLIKNSSSMADMSKKRQLGHFTGEENEV